MKPLLLSLALCLLANTSLACESYEECLKASDLRSGNEEIGFVNLTATMAEQIYAIRAIAYKLNEIEKKLGGIKTIDTHHEIVCADAVPVSQDSK